MWNPALRIKLIMGEMSEGERELRRRISQDILQNNESRKRERKYKKKYVIEVAYCFVLMENAKEDYGQSKVKKRRQ
jgi:hypothetical protein